MSKDFLCHEWHDWVKEAKDLIQSVKENRTCDNFLFFVIAIKDFLGQLNVPVRKLVPDEVIEDVSSHTKLKFVKVSSCFSDGFIEVVENPAVSNISSFLVDNFSTLAVACSRVKPSLFMRM